MAAKLSREQRAKKMMYDPIPKLIWEMSIPTIIAFLITSIYNLADTFFVSTLGTNATAAVSVNQSLDQIIMMTGSMLAIGANSYIARLLGAGEKKKADHVLSTAFFTAMGFGLALAVVGWMFMVPMVRLLGATDTCEQYSIQYATYVLLVAPFMAANFVMNQCLRAEGSAMRSMLGMAIGGIINCILDPIFIFGLGLGVAGASMATAISKLISFGVLIYPYLSGSSSLRISLKLYQLIGHDVKEVVSIGSSSLFRNLLAVLAAIILNNIAGSISDSVLAGIGVCNKIMMFPFGIILGFGSGYQPVAGFNWGAKIYTRVRECYHYAARTAVIGAILMGLLVGIFANPIIGAFATTDAEMLRVGALCIRLQCLALPIHAWVCIVNMFCAGLGFAKSAMALATSRQGSCFLPIIFPLTWLFGANGLAAVQAVADVLTLIIAIPLLRFAMKRVNEAEALAIQNG